MQTAHPTGTAGEAYAVGTAENNTVYTWDIDNLAWVDVGPIRGPKGDTGETGATGATGPAGPYYVPNVDSVGYLSWSNTGGLPNPDTRYIRGPQGIQGIQGPAGATGPMGHGLEILDIYTTLAALQAAHPTGTEGEAYAVGSSTDNVIYI